MAIDSATKRMSMLGFASPLEGMFKADGTIGADNRFTLLHLYGGLVGAGENFLPVFDNRRRRFRSASHRFRRGRK